MREQDRKELRAILERRINEGGASDIKTPLTDEVLNRWAELVIEPWAASDSDVLAEDMLTWWERQPDHIRKYVLVGPGQAPSVEPDIDLDEKAAWQPSWWPVYEQHVSDLIRPLAKQWLDSHPGPLDVETFARWLETPLGFRVFPAFVQDFVQRIDEHDSRIRFAPVSVGASLEGLVPTITITVRTPYIDWRLIGHQYEYLARKVRGDLDAPPNVTEDSVRFYRAYEALVRSGVRSKPARLRALPDDVRGKRSPNSAAAYHGKLKRSFSEAFDAITGRWWLHKTLVALAREKYGKGANNG